MISAEAVRDFQLTRVPPEFLDDPYPCGKTLPAGTLITIGIGAAYHDPAQFTNPGRFDVDRKPNRRIAFGQGDHVCVGMNVARMEGRIAFSRLRARFSRIELAGAPERDRRIRLRGFRRLPVRVG